MVPQMAMISGGGSLLARTKRSRLVGVAVALGVLAAPAQASAQAKQYVLRHPKHEHCRTHYVKRAETVKKHERGRSVKVRETLCVYVAPKITPSATAPNTPGNTLPTAPLAPVIPQPTPIVTLAADLDPTFTQDPANPLIVTYTYDASATQTVSGVTAPETDLPAGILDLYSDGLLACSINVGGSTTGGQCQVTYSTTGAHTVVVTYESGSASATATYSEQINPFGTTTSDTVVSNGCTTDKHTETETEAKCTFTVDTRIFDSNGDVPPGEGELQITGTGKTSAIPGKTEVTEVWRSIHFPAGAASCVIALETWTYPKHETDEWGNSKITGSSGCTGYVTTYGSQAEDAEITSWSVAAVYPGRLGWLTSQSAPQTISP